MARVLAGKYLHGAKRRKQWSQDTNIDKHNNSVIANVNIGVHTAEHVMDSDVRLKMYTRNITSMSYNILLFYQVVI